MAYIPTGCKSKGSVEWCKVHVHYHPDMPAAEHTWHERKQWIAGIGLNEYGEANNIIMLYPQALGSKSTGRGCWNWIASKEDTYFDTKNGVQLETVNNMVQALPSIVQGIDAIELPEDQGPPPVAHGSDRDVALE